MAHAVLDACAVQATAPSNVISLPLILVVGATIETEARCRSVAVRSRFLVRTCAVHRARPEALQYGPLAIVVPDELYRLAPRGFDLLSEDARSVLVRLEAEVPAPVVLEYRLMGAVLAAAKMR